MQNSRGRPSLSPTTSRTEKHRQAQARYRQKKEQRIIDLETQIRELEASAAPGTSSEQQAACCPLCPTEAAKLQEALDTLSALQKSVRELEMIHQPVGVDMIQAQVTTAGHLSSSSSSSNSSGISSIASSTSSSRLVDHHHQDPAMAVNTTATQQEQLETPSSDFETMRRELKALPSLQFNAHVDELVDTRMLLDGLSQDQDKRQCVLRLVALKHKLLDSCSIMERKRVLEIIEWFRYRNNNVSVNLTSNDRIQQIIDSTDNHRHHHHHHQQESGNQSSFNPSVVSAFRDSLLAIPSLHQSIDLIDAFVKCFWEQNTSNSNNSNNTTNKERTSEESRDHALVVMEMTRRLAKQCSGQDLAAFLMAIEVGRIANKSHAEDVKRALQYQG